GAARGGRGGPAGDAGGRRPGAPARAPEGHGFEVSPSEPWETPGGPGHGRNVTPRRIGPEPYGFPRTSCAGTILQFRSRWHFTIGLKGLSKFRLLDSPAARLYIDSGKESARKPGRKRGHLNLTVDEEIRQIGADVTKLKIQFDLYFAGSVPKPPSDQRDALDKRLKKVQFSLKSPGERFLYNSVLNKFNAYTELWLKQLRVKEE